MMRTHSRRCERAREYASLRLDGELSDFETTLLESHLDRCGTCRAFAADLAALTDRLRTAPLQQPAVAVSLPARRLPAFRRIQVSAAAALVVTAVGIATLTGLLRSGTAPQQPVSPRVLSPMAQESRQFRDLRRSVLTQRHPERRPGGLGVLSL